MLKFIQVLLPLPGAEIDARKYDDERGEVVSECLAELFFLKYCCDDACMSGGLRRNTKQNRYQN